MRSPESFELGPIRPPSEAGSYLLRLTRGCPWNRCGFCTTYKRVKFEIREPAAVEADIDTMARVRDRMLAGGRPSSPHERQVATALAHGGNTAFLQDGDSLAMKPDAVRRILRHFREHFPEVARITTYARSRTLASRSTEDLSSYRELGLTRIHVGLETGHDPLLRLVTKGVTADIHVKGGRRVVEAGIELSEYVMPGLGGREMSAGHADDTARVLSDIGPRFIRLRTLCLGPRTALAERFGPGGLTRLTDLEIMEEIRRFVENLDIRGAYLASDHILNLLGELEGSLPEDKPRMLALVDSFLGLGAEEQRLFQVGRRAGIFHGLEDLSHPLLRSRAEGILDDLIRSHGPEGVEEALRSVTSRFV